MLTQNLILELVLFIIICIILCVSIYYKDTLLGYFIKSGLKGGSKNIESVDDMINRVKRSDSIQSFVSDEESVSSVISSVIDSVISSTKSDNL